jgi:YVTN family beta-propeller protein
MFRFYNSSGTPYASSVAVGAHPDGLVVDGSGLLYVRNSGSGTVSVVNPQAGYTVTNITVGSFPSAYNDQQTLSFDSGVNLVAVGITGGVAYIDPTTLSVKTIVSLTSNPSELISNPAAQQTYSVSTPGYGAVNILRD